MSQCPVPALPAGRLRLKDLADPFGKRKVTITVPSHVVLDGAQVAAAVRKFRDKRYRGDAP